MKASSASKVWRDSLVARILRIVFMARDEGPRHGQCVDSAFVRGKRLLCFHSGALLYSGVLALLAFSANGQTVDITSLAVGNGVADDTIAIQQAINGSAIGSTIAFGDASKTYLVSGTLTFPGGRTYSGAATILLGTPPQQGYPLILLPNGNASDTTIGGLTFDAGGFSSVMHIATIGATSSVPPTNVTITGCTFRNTPGTGSAPNIAAAIYDTIGLVNSSINNNQFINIGHGLSIVNPSNLVVTGNTFNTVTAGDAMYFPIFQPLSGLTIANNQGQGLYRMAIEIQSRQVTASSGQQVRMDNVSVHDNTFSNWLTPSDPDAFGISIVFAGANAKVVHNQLTNGTAGYGIEAGNPGLLVSGNLITGFPIGVGVSAPGVIVSNNALSGQSDTGIQLTNANQEIGTQVLGNSIVNSKRIGIATVQGDHHGSVFKNNTILRQAGVWPDDNTNVFQGILVAGGLSAPVGLIANTIHQTSSAPITGFSFMGISLYGHFPGTVYDGNVVISDSSSPAGTGFYLADSSILDGDTVKNSFFKNLASVDTNGPPTGSVTVVANTACNVAKVDLLVTVQGCSTPPPTATITFPANNQTVSGTLAISAVAGGGTGVANVQFAIDGSNIGVVLQPPYTLQVDTTALGNGTHVLIATSTDLAGAATTSPVVTIQVSNAAAPLACAVSSPANDQTVSGTFFFSAAISGGSGTASAVFGVDGNNIATVLRAPYFALVNTAGLANGAHILTVSVSSPSGSQVTCPPTTVQVSNPTAAGPLTSALIFPLQYEPVSGAVALTAAASGGTGVQTVQFTVDLDPVGSPQLEAPFGASLDTTTLSNGTHLLTVVTRDMAGNLAISPTTTIVVLNGAVGPGVCPAPANGSFTGCYYSTTTNPFTTLLLGRNDPTINFNWTGTSPDPSVPNFNYSVHWEGNFIFAPGTYVFTITTNDGSRLWIDPAVPLSSLAPNPVIDHWYEQNTNTYTATVAITGGQHLVRMDYFKAAIGSAVASLSWTQVGQITPLTSAVTQPANNQTVSGTTVLSAALNGGAGGVAVQFAVDQNNVGPVLSLAPFTTTVDTTQLGNGSHTITATARDSSGAVVVSSPITMNVENVTAAPAGTCFAPGSGSFTGCYYITTSNFFSSLLLARTDPAINFNWTGTSPDPNVPNFNYSVHWEGSFTFAAGNYTFTLTTNDGSRLWIDPTVPIATLPPSPIIDVWFEQNTNTYTANVTLTAGPHLIRMDYFKAAVGSAVAQLNWARVQ